jgi:hypothetical protein
MLLENASAGDIVTFYSYKGGTGRSMALANVGVILARGVLPKEKPVLMIDWDLEAPGLYKYFLDDERLSSLWAKPRSGGLIELLTEVAKLYNELAAPLASPPRMTSARSPTCAACPSPGRSTSASTTPSDCSQSQ